MNQESSSAKNVGILLYDGVQVTDFTGPYDVFVLARPASVPNPVEAPPRSNARRAASCSSGQSRSGRVTFEGGGSRIAAAPG